MGTCLLLGFSCTIFFTHLARLDGKIDEIYVCGHSLETVDAPYFEAIIRTVNSLNVKWVITYYKDMEGMKAKALGLNIDMSNTTFLKLEDLH